MTIYKKIFKRSLTKVGGSYPGIGLYAECNILEIPYNGQQGDHTRASWGGSGFILNKLKNIFKLFQFYIINFI